MVGHNICAADCISLVTNAEKSGLDLRQLCVDAHVTVWIDTLDLARRCPTLLSVKSKTVTSLYEHITSTPMQSAHSALGDVSATFRILDSTHLRPMLINPATPIGKKTNPLLDHVYAGWERWKGKHEAEPEGQYDEAVWDEDDDVDDEKEDAHWSLVTDPPDQFDDQTTPWRPQIEVTSSLSLSLSLSLFFFLFFLFFLSIFFFLFFFYFLLFLFTVCTLRLRLDVTLITVVQAADWPARRAPPILTTRCLQFVVGWA